jgi:hypothetical protein
MPSQVDICNRALQILGQRRITTLTDGSAGADACAAAWDACLEAELRAHPWNCAVKRAELAADATEPTWGRANAFQLPSDFLRLLRGYPEDLLADDDYQIEGRKILTDSDGPLYIRYIYKVEDPNEMDALFREALAFRLALAMCEELTQSNTKKELLMDEYKAAVREARRVNAFENRPAIAPDDTWLSRRS